MKVSFFMRHAGYVRNFESTIRMLAQRGHQVDLAFDMTGKPDPELLGRYVQRLVDENPNVTYRRFRVARKTLRGAISSQIRSGIDYLRYFETNYDTAPKLRERASRAVSPILRSVLGMTGRHPTTRVMARKVLGSLERLLPFRPEAQRYLQRWCPDLVLVTPLVDIGSNQVEYVRIAHSIGSRTCLCVASWDNLTNKGVIKTTPDIVAVWNNEQKKEAVEMHGVRPERVVVTGAQSYDHWFEWKPSCSEQAFKEKVGLFSDRPYVLYLCSSEFISPREPEFVDRWIQALRKASHETMRTAGILIRPHPGNTKAWENVDLSRYENVVIFPRAGANPVDINSRSDYFDSLYYSRAVVGVNTSAQVEASILGKPIHTILDPQFADTQTGTLHFHLLLNVNGGLLHVAKDLAEHTELLTCAFEGDDLIDERSQKFVDAFIRPCGREKSATANLVDSLEALVRKPAPQIRMQPQSSRFLRPFALFVAGLLVPDAIVAWAIKRRRARLAKQSEFPAEGMYGQLRRKIKPVLRVLFVLEYPGYLRYFDSTIDSLIEKGHEVTVAFDDNQRYAESLESLHKHKGRVHILKRGTPVRKDLWATYAYLVRSLADYIKYLHPRFRDASYLRARMARRLPFSFGLLRYVKTWPARVVMLLLRFLEILENAIPSSRVFDRFIEHSRADVVLVSPLVTRISRQTDVVKSCVKKSVPVGVCVASWDHLTNKGYMRIKPDRVFLWNEHQKEEAVSLHNVPEDRVVVTGAQPFDKWFNRQVSFDEREFKRRVGLDEEKPFILFVGSTASISPPEIELAFIRDLSKQIRESEQIAVREVGILIRPHPYNTQHWQEVDLSEWKNVTVWPRTGSNPVNELDRSDYFHSLAHSSAVVGINTSAMIEAAILNRPVFTIRVPGCAATQEGTLHFHYMLDADSGCVEQFNTVAECLLRVGDVLNGDWVDERTKRFVDRFIRPPEVSNSATETLVEGIIDLGQRIPQRVDNPHRLGNFVAFLVAGTLAAGSRSKLYLRKKLGLTHKGAIAYGD